MVEGNKVSVIMPAYNSCKFVAAAMDSVLNQTYGNWELLAIDDGSTDATGEIIDSYARLDSRVTAFHTENLGVSHARNLGLDNATGEWVMFLDSDDLMRPDAMADLLAASNGMDLVIGNYFAFPCEKQHAKVKNSCSVDKAELLLYLSLAVWGMIFRRDAIRERFTIGIQYGEDTIFLLEFLAHCERLSTVHNVVYGRREGELDSLSHQRQNVNISFVDRVCQLVDKHTAANRQVFYTFVAYYFVSYINAVVNFYDLPLAEKRALIEEALEREVFRNTPLVQLNLMPKNMRQFVVLKTGDMALIEEEFARE